MKFFFLFLLGLSLGGGAGYYAGTFYESQRGAKILASETEKWAQQINQSQEQMAKTEATLQEVQNELKLNEDRAGFVTGRSLEAPQFDPSSPQELSSDRNGDILLSWLPVKGAKRYIVTVEDESGQVISTTDVEGEPKMLLNRVSSSSKLPAAQYFARVTAINGLDQEGAKSEKKTIHFNARSLASAPKAGAHAGNKTGSHAAKKKK